MNIHSLYSSVYLEVNMIGIMLTVIVLIRNNTENHRRASDREYNHMAIATLIALVADGGWILIDGVPGQGFIILNNLINTTYMFLTGLTAYFWLKCVLYKLNLAPAHKSIADIAIAIPVFLLAIFSAASPLTGWLFSISENNVYIRGPFLSIQHILCYTYLGAAFIISIVYAIRTDKSYERSEALTLASFAIIPTIGSITNIAVEGMPSIWPFVAVSLMMVYMNLQSLEISTDVLTGLYNRRQFDRFLADCTENIHRDRKLFLILIDIDSFKSINDTFGHQVGDRALIEAAGLLKDACNKYDVFLARYGGDEFAIIMDSRDCVTVEQLKDDIDEAFGIFNDKQSEPFTLTLSLGMSEFVPQYDSTAALFSRADSKLYEMKNEKKL